MLNWGSDCTCDVVERKSQCEHNELYMGAYSFLRIPSLLYSLTVPIMVVMRPFANEAWQKEAKIVVAFDIGTTHGKRNVVCGFAPNVPPS